MGNKQSQVSTTTEVTLKPRCVHKGCTRQTYAGFVQCLEHATCKAVIESAGARLNGDSTQTGQ